MFKKNFLNFLYFLNFFIIVTVDYRNILFNYLLKINRPTSPIEFTLAKKKEKKKINNIR